MAPLWRDLGLGVGLSLLCLLVSGGIAFYYGRMILTDLRGLHNSVMAWGKFQKPAAQSPVKSIAELQNIALAFETVTRQRMEAEQALRESEDRFRKVFENAATGIAITNWDGRFQQCNPTFCALLGYTAEELRRIEVASIIHPEDRDTHLAEIRRLQAGELQFFQIENRLVRKDGQPVWVHKFASVLPDAMGKPAHLVALVTDITERKRAEEELRQSRKDLDRAQEVGQIGSWRLDVRRNVLKWSDETYRIFGVPQGTPLTYESFMAIVHPDDRRYVDMQWKAGLDGEPYDVEHRIVVSDQTKWVREKAYLEFDDAGHLIGGFGIAQDITERKRAEEALRDSEEKFRSAFANAAIGFAMTTPDGSFVDANPAYCAITGYGIEELRTLAFQQLIHPDDFAENMRLFDRMLAGQIADFVVENRYFRKGGGAVWVRKSVSLVRNAVSAPQWIIVLVEDVTERKQTEEMLRQLNETLEQRVSERTQLAEARARQLQALAMELLEAEERERRRVAELLHDDLQQILAAARMQLQAACENLPSEPLLTNVEQLLEQSISRSRRLSHELSPTVLHHSSLVAALQWLAQQMRNQFGLQVQLVSNEAQRFENAPLKVFVFRAVQELLFNVVKHAGVKSVRLSLSGSVRSLVLTVSDLGQGFSPDVLDSAAETGGFGLLSLRERARYFGGSLAIESAPGKGSCFTLTLPIRLERTGESERLEVHRQPLTQAGATVSVVSGRIRLLLVDDHQVMRQGLRKLIAGQPDIEVAGEASNGREAIEQVRQLKPDVVVMDVSMPVMDGIEATRCIKAEMPEVRVIGLSMYEEEHIARSMREAGTEAFVRKTAPSAELLKAIYGVDRD